MWGPQDSVQLVYISNNYGLWYVNNYSFWGESKPTNITGGGLTLYVSLPEGIQNPWLSRFCLRIHGLLGILTEAASLAQLLVFQKSLQIFFQSSWGILGYLGATGKITHYINYIF